MTLFKISCLTFISVAALSAATSAQVLDDTANMKILKARSRLMHENRANTVDEINRNTGSLNNVGGQVNCGSVDIGNQVTSGGIGQDVSVIITGDIINTNNRCINTRGNN